MKSNYVLLKSGRFGRVQHAKVRIGDTHVLIEELYESYLKSYVCY